MDINRQTNIFYLSLLVVVSLVVGLCAGCTPTTPAELSLTPTATSEVPADCFQSATALAWLDENGDGMWDDGEPPLAGIEFVLEPTAYSRTTSDENGVADIFATTPGGNCPDALKVMVVGYEGYTLTTSQTQDYISADEEYLFGFQLLPPAVLIETEVYTGVVFAAESTAELITWLDEPADSFWTPAAEDVANFEDGLAAFLQESYDSQFIDTIAIAARLPEYTRQYFGLVQADEALIFANFFCDALGTDWEETAVVVMDGGDCYFQVMYNADAKTFVSLHINGES